MASVIAPAMRAWQFSQTRGGMEKNLQLNPKAPLPPHSATALGQNKVLVQVIAASLNPVDYKMVEMPLVGRFVAKKPSTPGLDFAGRIAATGTPGDAQVGQLVFGRLEGPSQFGTLAEYTVAEKGALTPVPEGVDALDAAGVGTAALVAYQSIVPYVKRGGGDRVFINGGSGGTGVWGIQIAKALGCHVSTSCSGRNVELCKSLGADEVIDYTREGVVEALQKQAAGRDSQPGHKYALVVDNVGNSGDMYWKCPRFTTDQATYVQIGAAISLRGTLDLMKKMMWPGFLGGGKRQFQLVMVKNDQEQLREIGQWMQQGKVKTVVDQVLRMEDAPQGFARLKSNRTTGKVVVKVAEK